MRKSEITSLLEETIDNLLGPLDDQEEIEHTIEIIRIFVNDYLDAAELALDMLQTD